MGLTSSPGGFERWVFPLAGAEGTPRGSGQEEHWETSGWRGHVQDCGGLGCREQPWPTAGRETRSSDRQTKLMESAAVARARPAALAVAQVPTRVQLGSVHVWTCPGPAKQQRRAVHLCSSRPFWA